MAAQTLRLHARRLSTWVSDRVAAERAAGGAAKVWADIKMLARAPGVLDMGQGFPDFAGLAHAQRGAQRALIERSHDQYAPPLGSDRLRQAIAGLYGRMYPQQPQLTLDEVSVFTSATEACFCSIMGVALAGLEPEALRGVLT